jgi:hypothetical protein
MRATIGLALMSMSTFYNTFSFAHPPALRIKPGDRVITVTIDAFGNDGAIGASPRHRTRKPARSLSKAPSPVTCSWSR